MANARSQAPMQASSSHGGWKIAGVEILPYQNILRAGPAGGFPFRRLPLAPRLVERIAAPPPPIIVFNKSHSGCGLIALLLREQGVFIGSMLNESLDAVPFFPLVECVVLDHYPDFSGLWQQPEWPAEIQQLLAKALAAHLTWCPRGIAWGWKLCETTLMLPLLATIFPGGRFIHLIRDGRDVAFSDHVTPEQTFWRKVYFQTDAVRSWRDMHLDHAACERRSHLFNARHWQESVRLGRAFGAMLGPAYREVRHEQVCADPVAEVRSLLGWLGIGVNEKALAAVAGRASATRSASTEPGRARNSLRSGR